MHRTRPSDARDHTAGGFERKVLLRFVRGRLALGGRRIPRFGRIDRWISMALMLSLPMDVRCCWIPARIPSSGAFGLVRKFLKECCPPGIVYRLRKQPTRPTFYVQVFDKNDSVVVDDMSGQLVLKIVALVENFAVHPGYQANRFLPALGKLLATCYATSCSTETLLCLLEPTRISDFQPVAPRHGRPQPDIQTNRLIVRRQWFRLYDATETGAIWERSSWHRKGLLPPAAVASYPRPEERGFTAPRIRKLAPKIPANGSSYVRKQAIRCAAGSHRRRESSRGGVHRGRSRVWTWGCFRPRSICALGRASSHECIRHL